MPGTVIQGHFPHGLGRIPRAQRQTGNAVELPQTMTAFGNLPGHPLPPVVRQKMEALFGTNFNDVRIHTGMHATQFGATAFTHGSNIHFAPGHYDPNSARGQHALGHELAHVVQQRTRRVQNPFGSGVAVVRDARLEAEAERMGAQATIQCARVTRTGLVFNPNDYPTRAELRRGGEFHPDMRASRGIYAAAGAVYDVADLATGGLIGDVSWYRAAVARGDMSRTRALAGLATTAAVKGGAAYLGAAYVGAGSTAARTAVRAAAATRAGRWAYSWVDSTMSWLGQDADGGRADIVASTYQRYVLGETIKTTGRVPVGGRTGSNASTNTAMGGISASNAAGRASKAAADSRHHYEWLHLKADCLGGLVAPNNLVAGSYHANTEMIPLENAIRAAADRGSAMEICVTAFCVAGTQAANRINYKVWKDGSKAYEKTIDAIRGPVSIVEMRLLENAATTALADNDGVGGLWSAARRFLPFH